MLRRQALKMKCKLKIFTAIAFLLNLSACGKIDNSSSTDKNLYGAITDVGSADFLAVKTMLRNSCISCHAEWNSYTDADFVSSGLVAAANATASKLYYRNQNATSGAGPTNMPSGGQAALTEAELVTMTNWINSL